MWDGLHVHTCSWCEHPLQKKAQRYWEENEMELSAHYYHSLCALLCLVIKHHHSSMIIRDHWMIFLMLDKSLRKRLEKVMDIEQCSCKHAHSLRSLNGSVRRVYRLCIYTLYVCVQPSQPAGKHSVYATDIHTVAEYCLAYCKICECRGLWGCGDACVCYHGASNLLAIGKSLSIFTSGFHGRCRGLCGNIPMDDIKRLGNLS